MMELNLKALEKSLVAICREVGDYISNEQNRVKQSEIELKSFNSLVSYVDQQAEKMLVEKLKDLVPNTGFITEEETISQKDEELNWIIDPLDGTTNFLHGLPLFAVSVALVYKNEPILGVVHECGQKESFSAYAGGGARLNGQAISVRQNNNISESLIATGFPYYDFERMNQFNELLSYFFKETRGLRRFGSAATDLAYVACGRFDAYYEYGLNAWDVAAGCLLVTESGGRVTDFKGDNNQIFGKEIVAGTPLLFEEIRKKVFQYLGSKR